MTDIVDRLNFAAECERGTSCGISPGLVEEAAAEIQSLRRRLAVHEERLPRVSEGADAMARRVTRPSRGVGEPSADWP